MHVTKAKLLIFSMMFLYLTIHIVNCEVQANKESDLGDELIEQGRTFVHGTLKRFMVIAPAVFFKLGIAFTLLLIVTLVAANNGFIGFLILVVGLSAVLSRFQGSSAPLLHSAPLIHPIHPVHPVHSLPLSYPALSHHHHTPWIDRSDTVDNMQKASKVVNGYYGVQQDYDSNSDLRNTGVYFKTRYANAAAINQ